MTGVAMLCGFKWKPALAASLGFNCYRMGVEWARIEPSQGEFSNAELDHYARMLDACRAKGLRPVVTLNHFTTPLWFAADEDNGVVFYIYSEAESFKIKRMRRNPAVRLALVVDGQAAADDLGLQAPRRLPPVHLQVLDGEPRFSAVWFGVPQAPGRCC